MNSRSNLSDTSWVKDLPSARAPYPDTLWDKLKYFAWRVITPFHNPVRDALLRTKVIRHHGRQEYLLGHLAPGQTAESLVTYLIVQGWGNHFIAWKDEGELVSLRRIHDFRHQYHLRIFKDGEVRGHFEYTPECHMVLHMQEVGMEPRREEFLAVLGNRIIPIS